MVEKEKDGKAHQLFTSLAHKGHVPFAHTVHSLEVVRWLSVRFKGSRENIGEYFANFMNTGHLCHIMERR